eukprot:2406026-Pyramimonas_sp.AAC.1
MTELDPEAPTHYIHDDQRLSQLDKVMISTPGWLLLHWSIGATVMQYPEDLFKQGVSDHAPLCITFGSRPQKA